MIRQIVQDFAVLEDSKIIQDDDKFLVVKAVIASEIVHKYEDGMAYKPADELEVKFTTEPTKTPGSTIVAFDDTCGTLIQLTQLG